MHNVLPMRSSRTADPEDGLAPEAAGADTDPDPHDAGVDPDPRTELLVEVDHVALGRLTALAVRGALLVAASGALGVVVLWQLADAGGLVERFESFMQSIGFRDFRIAPTQVLVGLFLVVTGVALMVAATIVLSGAVYNLLARPRSGLRLRLVEAPLPAVSHRPAVARREAQARPQLEDVVDLGVEPVPELA